MKALMLTLLAAATVPAQPQPLPVGNLPIYERPAKAWSDVESANAARCRDVIIVARADRTAPELDRQPEDGKSGQMVYAVDRRVDGCSVAVPVAQTRPDPQTPPQQR